MIALFGLNKYLKKPDPIPQKGSSLAEVIEHAGKPEGKKGLKVEVSHMLKGGSGSQSLQGHVIETNIVKCEYVINCAGGASDQIARMIGDDSFKIKPRLGDYLLLNRNQVRSSAQRTYSICPFE